MISYLNDAIFYSSNTHNHDNSDIYVDSQIPSEVDIQMKLYIKPPRFMNS